MADYIKWNIFLKRYLIPEKIIELAFELGKLPITDVLMNQVLSSEFLDKHSDKIHDEYWDVLSIHQKLSEEFIDKYQDELCWENICRFQNMSKDFVMKHLDKIKLPYLEMNIVIPRHTLKSIIKDEVFKKERQRRL
jgi:hypothetical protein